MTKTEQFIQEAKQIHGDQYDYSQVEYVKATIPVRIFCKTCRAFFMQQPTKHTSKRQGCPKCRYTRLKSTLMSRYGVDNPMQLVAVKSKIQKTCVARYGVPNAMQNESVKNRKEKTCMDRYGVNSYSKTKEYKEKVQVTCQKRYGSPYYSCTEECKNKVRNTVRKKYGVNNVMQLDEVKQRFTSYMSTDMFRQKTQQTMLQRYGVSHYSKTDEFKDKVKRTCQEKYGADAFFSSSSFDRTTARQKARATCLQRYGTMYYQQSSDFTKRKDKINKKIIQTKLQNNTFHTSGPEEKLYDLLIQKYGADDVVRQYQSDVYPFACDFYIKSTDTYIELNLMWTHGGHFFDETNPDDIKKLQHWQELAKHSQFYRNAIYNWTIRDKKKQEAGKHINYVALWTIDDVNQWVN